MDRVALATIPLAGSTSPKNRTAATCWGAEPHDGGHPLLMLDWPGAAWHLGLVADAATTPTPIEEDLLRARRWRLVADVLEEHWREPVGERAALLATEPTSTKDQRWDVFLAALAGAMSSGAAACQ